MRLVRAIMSVTRPYDTAGHSQVGSILVCTSKHIVTCWVKQVHWFCDRDRTVDAAGGGRVQRLGIGSAATQVVSEYDQTGALSGQPICRTAGRDVAVRQKN